MPDTTTFTKPAGTQKAEHFDVLIVGAGISGVGGAYHLTKQCPGTSFVVLETQESFGGTWLTHRYPGIRSDSDLYTFGYRFKPWTGAPIATAAEILAYMGEVIEENDLGRHIRYRHKIDSAQLVERATISGRSRRTRTDTGENGPLHREFPLDVPGILPALGGLHARMAGDGEFKGRIVHPQTWPEDLDYKGKKVVVIGSGATAATLIPAMAADCAPHHHAAALADLFHSGAQRQRTRRHAARAADRRDVDPRDRAPQDPARSGRLHAPLVRRAGGGEAGTAGGGARLSRSRLRHRRRTSRRATGRGGSASPSCRTATCSGGSRRQGIGRHRRDRTVHRDGHPAEVRQAAGGRHHRHRDRLQPQRAWRHRLRDRRQAARSSPTRSPIAA